MGSVRILALMAVCGLQVSHAAYGDNRTMDGSANNIQHPTWGQAGSNMVRGASGAHYADGMGSMVLRANPRVVSNFISAQVAPVGNARGMSSMIWQWGQFIDHDFALVLTGSTEAVPMMVPAGDPVFDPDGTGTHSIEFFRSVYTGGGSGLPRDMATIDSHWIDGSQVYGSDDARASALREHVGGRMLVGSGDMLPFNTMGLLNAGGPSATLRVAGDIRCNEQTGLAAMHTIFVREHNRWAGIMEAAHPDWTDEQIYQKARKMVSGEIEAITYNTWLPALLGSQAPGAYPGYDENIDPSLNTAFTSAAYRIGHTLLNERLLRFNEDGSDYAGGHLTLAQTFFNPSVIANGADLDAVVRGLARQQANEVDTQAIDSVRNMLFGDQMPGDRDLIATNLQRGRDHGIPDYNSIRVDYGLPARTSFSEITSDTELAANLSAAYNGDINNIDAWIGLMAEDHMPDSSVGETVAAIFRDQFGRLRNCDRMFYLHDSELTPSEIAEIDATTLADVIRRNTGIVTIQDNVFFAPPVCACDTTGDGTLDSQDFFAFLGCFLSGDCGEHGSADFNHDGVSNSQDFFDYLNCFFAGCSR